MHHTSGDFAPPPIRLIVRFGFMLHGWPKLVDAAAHQNFVGMLEGIAAPATGLFARFVGAPEVFGGLALNVGALVGIVAILQTTSMLVALSAVYLRMASTASTSRA
jgi:putative oxidoreductase